jgi:large subunit ribosomal protein L29
MNANQIRELPVEELETKLKDLKQELFNLRFQLAINQLDNPTRIKAVKKDIARVSTVIREAQLADEA